MNDPKNRPLMYLIAGVVAIAASLYFMTLEASIFDWFILGMGVVSIFRGVQEYWQRRGGSAGRKEAGKTGPDSGSPDGEA